MTAVVNCVSPRSCVLARRKKTTQFGGKSVTISENRFIAKSLPNFHTDKCISYIHIKRRGGGRLSSLGAVGANGVNSCTW